MGTQPTPRPFKYLIVVSGNEGPPELFKTRRSLFPAIQDHIQASVDYTVYEVLPSGKTKYRDDREFY